MHVRFGLYKDGPEPTAPETVAGTVTVGPNGLLRLLEADLGLPPVLKHSAEVLIAYRRCLAEADDFARFYHRSFSVDPIGVAHTLMAWREEWYAAGWSGRFKGVADGRLADMAAVEKLARDVVPACRGQRVARIVRALSGRRTQIDRLELLDRLADMPKVWRQLIDKLGDEPSASRTAAAAAIAARPGTDLETLQRELIGADRAQGAAELRGDGSVVVLTATSRDLSARAIAEAVGGAAQRSVIVAERDGIIIDNALDRAGFARAGLMHRSKFRAVAQVLRLALALMWEPLNPHLLLQFLLHPLGPVPRNVRRVLAEAVARQPGIGGGAWSDAVELLESRFDDDAKLGHFRELMRYWFESPRFPASRGAPLAAVSERAERCAVWLNGRLGGAEEAERSLYASALYQCQTLITALAELAEGGQSRIDAVELDRILDEVAVEETDPTGVAEAGHINVCTHPGAVSEPVDQVVWWDMAAPKLDFVRPWSKTEQAALAAAGVELIEPDVELEQLRRSWLRPLLSCRERLILVVHNGDTGQHPLWSQIRNRVRGYVEVGLDEALLQGDQSALPVLDVVTPLLSPRALPAPRRWWRLPNDVELPPRSVESYTSLAKLYDFPHQWVLRYAARLERGRASDLADNALLYGSLAHGMIDQFFTTQPDWRDLVDEQVSAWLDATLPTFIAEEGATLLEPGRGVDRQHVSTTLERALLRLVAHLRDAGAVSVQTERHERVPFHDGELQGDIDLLITTESGIEVVMDAKWGSEKFRSREMQSNRHLQLATYAFLRRTETGVNRWPYPAYFIVTSGNVLAPDASVFPEAIVLPPDAAFVPAAGEDVAALWHAGEASYAWRRGQLDEGLVEVNVDGTEPTERSVAPVDALPSRLEADMFDEFGWLTGQDEYR